RSLGEVVSKEVEQNNKGHEEVHKVVPKQDQDQNQVTESANDLLTMDYTPARKKPPIHN
ncbi:hypothetical protein PanWU01x14_241920, partial [Parasponia andersonii]